MMRTLLAVDIGGTNVRFAFATEEGGGGVSLRDMRRYPAAGYPGLAEALGAFVRDVGRPLPDIAAIALAGPAESPPFRLTNSGWVLDSASLRAAFGFRRLMFLNDFAAMAHGVAALPPERLRRLFGQGEALPACGAITVVGPGTGLGVGLVSRGPGGGRVIPTEGGHIGFAPVDAAEDRLLAALRARFGRVSAERLVSGPGLAAIWAALAPAEARAAEPETDAGLWRQALAGEKAGVRAALRQLIRSYGAVAGDLALAHGAAAVVLAGGLTGRMVDDPLFVAFRARFCDKGRHRARMEGLPVFYADYPELGLFGVAVAGLAGEA